MGLLPKIKELGYRVGEVRLVDREGRTCGGFSVDIFQRLTHDRFTSVLRSDLSATIYSALVGRIETLFGDSIASIEDKGDRVVLGFESTSPREFDLVIGADGLHSRVRQLSFGPQRCFEFPLGYHVAAFAAAGYQPRDELVYIAHGIPGKQVSRFSMRGDKTMFLFVFRDEYLGNERPHDDPSRKAVLRRIFSGAGWECPRILESLEGANDLYFDRVSQIRIDRWAKGRVALIGDAAACVSLLAGEGTGLALAEAFVLAGELRMSQGDHAQAFASYQERLMPFLRSKQKSAAGFASSFAPKSAMGIKVRNTVTRLMRLPFVAALLINRGLRDDLELPDYGFGPPDAGRMSIAPAPHHGEK
jgi:2-polyprenyl-6-methoxyphenol hydroxylase-like FAD-dependent oxidoreductase